MTKKIVLSLLFLGLSIIQTAAQVNATAKEQSKPNFSGTWKLDKSKEYFMGFGVDRNADLVLAVSHTEPELRVIYKFAYKGQALDREFVYYTDGRGEVSRTFMEYTEARSKTSWQGNKLTTVFIIRGFPLDDPEAFEITQEWKLSSDGKTLTQTQRTRPVADRRPVGVDATTASGMRPSSISPVPAEFERVFRRKS